MASFMRRFGTIGLTFAVIAAFTRAYYLGDTLTYTNDILAFDRGFSNVPVGPLWEFGHLIWRPLGFVLYKFLWALLPASLGLDERLVCTVGLISFSLFCGWLAVTLFYSLATQVTRSALLGYVIAVSLMCTNAFLNHMHAGHAYVPAVAFLTLGIWLLVRRATILFACAAGTALAFSALLWFPFVLVIPAGLLVGLLGTDALGHTRARFVVVAALSCACVGLLGYAVGAFEVQTGPHGDVEAQFASKYGYSFSPQSTSVAWAQDIAKIVQELFIVDSNNASNIGGGPTTDLVNRLAPAICDIGTPGSGIYDCGVVVNVAVTGVSVSPTTASVPAGGTTTLTATVAPSNATNKNVTWSSSNTAVATEAQLVLLPVLLQELLLLLLPPKMEQKPQLLILLSLLLQSI